MTPEARQRLETIAEQTELGAGYGIAMRDLEMRGAGDLLGMRQHGHIAAVGFHLYTRLLRKAVQQLKRGEPKTASAGIETEAAQLAPGGPRPPLPEGPPSELSPLALEVVSVDLPLPTIIPPDYVPDRQLRLQLYRRLAELGSEQAVAAVRAELSDRFGPLPEPVENLLFQLEIKILAARAGVESVAGEDGQIVLKGPRWATEEQRALLAGRLGPGVRLSRRQLWLARAGDQAGWRARLVEVLARLAEITIPETVH
jgi:transcription-repair coupling factor (superfamily II helicase)